MARACRRHTRRRLRGVHRPLRLVGVLGPLSWKQLHERRGRWRATAITRLRDVQAVGFTVPKVVGATRPGCAGSVSRSHCSGADPPDPEWLTARSAPLWARSGSGRCVNVAAIEAGVDSHPAQARVHLGGGTGYCAGRPGRWRPACRDRDIVVTMEASSPTERREVFSRSDALTGARRHAGPSRQGVDTRRWQD